MKTYKFRAECSIDIITFFKAINSATYDSIHIHYMEGDTRPLPDREVVFTSSISHRALVILANSQENCHVIAQTLQPIDQYTGERNYNI